MSNIKLFRAGWSDPFLNVSNVMFCSNLLIVAAVEVAVAMVAVVGVVVVVIRSGTIIMHDRVALVLAQTQMQQQVRTVNKTVHYLYNSTRRPVHQIINCRDCGRTVPRDCGQTVPRDCGRTVPRDCRDCGRLSYRLIDVSYRRDLALWHGAVSR